jgi:hypothetical protein
VETTVTNYERCPIIGTGDNIGIRANAIEFMERNASELDSISPNDIPLTRLKLEADTMVAVALNLFKDKVFTDQTLDWAVENFGEQTASSRDAICTEICTEAPNTLSYLFNAYLEGLAESEGGQEFLERMDHYRSAYFKRSPLSHSEERLYQSNSELMGAASTLGSQGRVLIFAIENAGKLAGLETKDRIELIKKSGHMAMLLAKLRLVDLTRYVDMLNSHEEVIYGMVSIQERGTDEAGEPIRIASFDRRVFGAMRTIDKKDRSRFNHRSHTGCVAAVDLDGRGSPASKGWEWLVGCVEKAGYWEPE